MDHSLALVKAVPTFDALLAQILLLAALVAVSAFVSGSEVALLALSQKRRRHQAADRDDPARGRRERAFERLMAQPDRFLITIVLVNTVANVAAAALVTTFAGTVFTSYVLAISTGVVTLVLLTFGEVAPKALAVNNAERWALAAAPVILVLQKVLFPLVWVYEGLARAVAGQRTGEGRGHLRSPEELRSLISLGAEEGVLEHTEEDMLQSVMEFSETTAREIMVPRIDMMAVPTDATLDHIRAYVVDSGFSRLPVYQGSLDNVVGILYAKDMLLHMLEKKGNVQVKELMREAYFVPESKKLDDLLTEMREKRIHVAIVIDEFGGTAGLITLEDVIEEIVGDIFDEYDLRHDPIRKLDPHTAVVDARTHVADVNHALDLDIPEDESYDTVAGYVYQTLGRLGKEGEVVHGPGFDLVVEKVTNRRILRARIVKHQAERLAAEAKEEATP